MRTETIIRKLYQFDELSDDAKEKARDWFRQTIEVEDWSEFVIEDAVNIGQKFGLHIDTYFVPLMNGTKKEKPEIWFDLDRRTIDFKWNYAYVPGSVKAVKGYAPRDEDLHQIVTGLQETQKSNFYQLQASKGRYGVDVTRQDDKEPAAGTPEDVEYWLQQFGEWILSNLRDEYDYQNSDESIDESIRINEYEFTEDGEIS